MDFGMKRVYTYIVIICASMALVSCEGLLDRFPQDKLSPETFLANETEMLSYTNTLYTMFPTGFFSDPQNDDRVGRALSDEMRGARNINSGDDYWSRNSWAFLRRINTFLEYSSNCKDEKVRSQYEGLVRFFRAYFYFEKVKRFGDVPWYDKSLGSDDEELYKARDSRELVMQKMLEDIDFAIDHLPSAHSDYRVTKWTALALKSRFCLFEGTFRKYHQGDATLSTLPADAQPYTFYLEQAADAAGKFISGSGYGIYNSEGTEKSYIGLFTKYNVSEGSNKEVILARDYDITNDVTHNANAQYVTSTLEMTGLTRKFIASYLMSDGTRFTDQAGWETKAFVAEVKNRDPRLSQTIRTPGYCRLGTTTRIAPNLEHSVTGYAPIKYFMKPEDDGNKQSYCDLILFRAAEVYLNYAEAKAELGTLSQTDINLSIKPLRDRVGMPNLSMEDANANPDPYLSAAETGYPKVTGPNKGVILEIRRERTIELVGEGFRYDDIIRWAEGKAFEQPLMGMYFPGPGSYDLDEDGVADVTLYTGDAVPSVHAAITYKIGEQILLSDGDSGCIDRHRNSRPGFRWDENKDYYYPIPVEDRNLCGGVLTQNPGWPDTGAAETE